MHGSWCRVARVRRLPRSVGTSPLYNSVSLVLESLTPFDARERSTAPGVGWMHLMKKAHNESPSLGVQA